MSGYMRNSVACLRYITLTEMLLICRIFLFSFYVYVIKGTLCSYDDGLSEISPFEAEWDKQKMI